MTPDEMVLDPSWSDLSLVQAMPQIDEDRLHAWRENRVKARMRELDVDLCLMVNPVSMRYAIGYRNYALFMTHIPSTYLLYPLEGDYVVNNAFKPDLPGHQVRPGRPIGYFYGGEHQRYFAEQLAQDVLEFLAHIGSDKRRVAVEYVNPSITQALEQCGLEVIDGVLITEGARQIKSADEVECIRWALAVASLGAAKVKEALKPGVSELQLWGLLNYTNAANNGDWHDGRVLASGPRINPWLQEASERKLEAGDLLGFDTDMVGPFGYCADLSRTMFCGPGKPTRRQKELYRLAMAEIEHNLGLIRAGVGLRELQDNAWPVPEEFRAQAYPCIVHGVGMCDEYPHVHPGFRGPMEHDDTIEAGMVLCIESYMGAVGERDGVKLEQQVLVTETGHELLTPYPFEEELM